MPLISANPLGQPSDRRTEDCIAPRPIWLLALLILLPAAVGVALFVRSDALVECRIGDCEIWLTETGGVDQTLKLHVTRAGQTQDAYVIDKSDYATLRMIRHQDRVLVANDRFIFAAYDLTSDQIIRYADLPFTIWEGQGDVLDSHQFGGGPARMRRGFPERRQGAETLFCFRLHL